MTLGQWCQVPGRALPHSPLRAFVGSSDELVRGAGRRPPPNRLSQEQKERETGGRGTGPGPVSGKKVRVLSSKPSGLVPLHEGLKGPDPCSERTPRPRPKKGGLGDGFQEAPAFPISPSRDINCLLGS